MPIYQVELDGQIVELESPTDLTPEELDREITGYLGGATPTQEQPGLGSQLLTSLGVGTRTALASGRTAFNVLTGDTEDTATALADLAAAQREAQAAQTPEDIAFMADLQQQARELEAAEGILPTLREAVDLPLAALRQPGAALKTAVQSLPNALISTPITLGAAAGSAALGTAAGLTTGPGAILTGLAGGIAGGTAANAALEIGAAAFDILNERTGGQAINWTREQIAEALRADPTILEEATRTGAIRGATIGTIDALSLGAAGRVAGTSRRAVAQATRQALVNEGVDLADDVAVRAGLQLPAVKAAQEAAQAQFTTAGELARGAAGAAIESVGEGGGELAAQIAAGQEVDTADAFLEMLPGAITGAGTALAARGSDFLSGAGKMVRDTAANVQRAEEVMGEAFPNVDELEAQVGREAADAVAQAVVDAGVPVGQPTVEGEMPIDVTPPVAPAPAAAQGGTTESPIDRMRKANPILDDKVSRSEKRQMDADEAAEKGITIEALYEQRAAEAVAARDAFWDSLEQGDVITWVDFNGRPSSATVESVRGDGSKVVVSDNGYEYDPRTFEFGMNSHSLSVQKGTATSPATQPVSEPTPITPVEPLPAVEAEAPAAVETQTQPEPQPRDEIQIAEAGGPPPVEGQPVDQAPAVEAPEGAALGGREGQEEQVTPEPVQPMGAVPAVSELPAPQAEVVSPMVKPPRVGNIGAIPTPEEEARWAEADAFNAAYVNNLPDEDLEAFGARVGVRRQGVSLQQYRQKILNNTHPDDLLDAIPEPTQPLPPTGGVPTESLPAGQPTSGDVGTARTAQRRGGKRQKSAPKTVAEAQAREAEFQASQELLSDLRAEREQAQRQEQRVAFIQQNATSPTENVFLRDMILGGWDKALDDVASGRVEAARADDLAQTALDAGQIDATTRNRFRNPATLPALRAVATNTATPEQVAGLEAQGLARTVQGQPVITDAGLAQMPEAERPRLTEAERVAEIQNTSANYKGRALRKFQSGVAQGETPFGGFSGVSPEAISTLELEDMRKDASAATQRDVTDLVRVYRHGKTQGRVNRRAAVFVEAADAYGIALPEGYVREGDLYVFRPEGGGAVPANTPPANVQPSIRPLQGDQQRNETLARRKRPRPSSPTVLRARDGQPLPNITVTPANAAKARDKESRQVPGASETWIGTSEQFLSEFADTDAGRAVEGNAAIEAFYDSATDRAVVLTDRVQVREGDARRAVRNGTSAAEEAVRRLIRHESFVHRGWRALPSDLRSQFLALSDSVVTADDLDTLAKTYRRYANWRDDPSLKALAFEEWLAQRIERIEKLPAAADGPLAQVKEWLGRVWQWLTGDDSLEATPTELAQVMRMMVRALETGEKEVAVDAGIRPSFIGEKAQMSQFMRDSLETARSMAAAGKSSEEIRAVTGWFPGLYDGKMRWELPDNEAAIKDLGATRLADLIDHPTLFSAYPTLSDVEVFTGPQNSYSPADDSITLKDRSLSVILHEVQHAIQKREGFAKGGDSRMAFADPRMGLGSKKGLAEANRILQRIVKEMATPMSLAGFAKSAWQSDVITDEIKASYEDYLRTAKKAAKDPNIQRIAQESASKEWYRRLAGEIEARDVQARRTMTPEQRRATAPYSSENIAPEDAVVIFDGREQGVMASLTDTDAAYMDAVARGDMETAQRLVDEAAYSSGFRKEGYHGTHRDFTIFDRLNAAKDRFGLKLDTVGNWFTDSPDAARKLYGPKVVRAYLDLKNPLRFDGIGGLQDFRSEVEQAHGSVDAFRKWAKSQGYDGVEISGDFVDGELQTFQIAFYPSQIKSADPVTYDDNGNVIPLSQRFQPESPDIRFSLTQDPNADTLRRIVSEATPTEAMETSKAREFTMRANTLEEDEKAFMDAPSANLDYYTQSVESAKQGAIKFVDAMGPVGEWGQKLLSPGWREATGLKTDSYLYPFVLAEALNRSGGIVDPRTTEGVARVRSNEIIAGLFSGIRTSSGQSLNAMAKIMADPRYAPMFVVQAARDMTNKTSATVVDPQVNVPAATDAVRQGDEQARQQATDDLAEELRLRDLIYDMGIAAQDEAVAADIRAINDDVFRIGTIERLLAEMDAGAVAPSLVGLSRAAAEQEFRGLTREQLIAERDRLREQVRQRVEAVKQAMDAKPKAKSRKGSDPASQAKALIDKLEASPQVPKKPKPNPVRDLYREHLKEPMAAEDFIGALTAMGVDIADAQKLYDLAAIKIAALETAKANRPSQKEKLSEAERFAERVINDAAEQFADPALPVEEKQRKTLPIRDLFNFHVQNGMTLEAFIPAAAQAGLDEATARRLHGAGLLVREARQSTKTARTEQKLDEMAAKEAGRLIYETSKLHRQSGYINAASPEADTIRKAFMDQVKKPVPFEQFAERLKALRVEEDLATRLFNVADREHAARKAVALERERQAKFRTLRINLEKALDPESDSMQYYVNTVRSKMEGAPTWQQIFNQPFETQRQWRQRIYEQIRNNPSLKNLTAQEARDLAAALDKVWNDKRERNLQSILKRANLPGTKEKTKQKIAESVPLLLRYLNTGVFNDDSFRAAVAKKFGAKVLGADDLARISTLAQEAQADGITQPERNQKLFEMVKIIQQGAGVELGEVISNYWVTAVLSGFRTQFDMALSSLNGLRVMAQTAADVAIRKRDFKMVGEAAKNYFKTMANAILESANYFVTGDPTLLDGYQYTMNQFLQEGIAASNPFDYFEQVIKDPRVAGWRKITPYFFAGIQRAMRIWDHINSTSVKEGMLPLAMALNQEKYRDARMPSAEDVAQARQKALAIVGGDKTYREKRAITAYTRQILNDLLESQYPGLLEEAREVGFIAAYQNDPTGIGGIIYHTLLGVTKKFVSAAGKFRDEGTAARANAEWSEARKIVDKFMREALYILASNARNLSGTRFVRFVGNRVNELISFTPIVGLARLAEKDMTESKKSMIVTNQLVGGMISLWVIASMMRAMEDEEDEDKRGWNVEGSWSNLTPQQKNQRRAEGRIPYSLKIGGVNFNYNAWPMASLFATVGNLYDMKRYRPDKWNEKEILDKTLSALWAGGTSFMDLSSLSGLMDLLGRSAYSTDPVEGAKQWAAKFSANYVGGFIPRALKDLDMVFDPEARKPDNLFGYFAKEIPFYRRTEAAGEKLYDIFGEPVQMRREPWSRSFAQDKLEPEYNLLGDLNERGIFLSPANPDNRTVGSGANRRELTKAEAEAYMMETGKLYKDYVLQQGERLKGLDFETAKAKVSKDTERLRNAALRRAISISAD